MTRRTTRRAQPAPEGFTAVLCRTENGCGAADDSLVEPLRAAVRQSAFGMLITTGCLARHLHCPHHGGNRVARPGIRLIVQPCTRDPTPLGAAVTFGPLTDASQAQDLADWLIKGLRQGCRPPRHLLAVRLPDRSASGTASRPGAEGERATQARPARLHQAGADPPACSTVAASGSRRGTALSTWPDRRAHARSAVPGPSPAPR